MNGRLKCIVCAFAFALSGVVAQASPVLVKNHSFESPNAGFIAPGFEVSTTTDSWTIQTGENEGGVFRVFNPGTDGNPSNADPNPNTAPRTQVAYMYTTTNNRFYQGLTTNDATPQSITYASGQQYTLTVGIGLASSQPGLGAPAPADDEITIGFYTSSALPTESNFIGKTTLTPVSGALTSTLLKDFSASTPFLTNQSYIGQQIFIQIFTTKNSGETAFGEFIFDNVRLEAVPEPGSAMVIAAGGAALLLRRRRSASV